MRHILLASLLLIVTGYPVGAGEHPTEPQAGSRQHSAEQRSTIDLNTADSSALESLPGVGPRTAELIIEYRAEAGGFKKVEELMNIRGIGETTFLRIRELVRVGASEGKS